jgi:hypothetical protein
MSKLLQLQPLGQGQIEYLLHLINMEEARLTAQLHTCADDQVDPLLQGSHQRDTGRRQP